MPTCVYSPSSNEQRGYAVLESTFATCPNTAGVATLTGSNFFRHTSLSLTPSQAEVLGGDITGGRQAVDGLLGKKSGAWSMTGDIRPHGVAGSLPDHNPFLVATFGAAPTVVSSTSATYNLADAVKSFALYEYYGARGVSPALIYNYGVGCIVSSASWDLTGDRAVSSFSGPAFNVVDNVTFVGAGTDEGEGGLTTYPAEPGTSTSNGNFLLAFRGAFDMDGAALPTIRGVRITLETGNVISGQRFASDYGNCPIVGTRAVGIEFQFQDTNSAAVNNIWSKAKAGTKINGYAEVGTVAGSRVRFTVNGLKLGIPGKSQSGLEWVRGTTARAIGTTSTSGDELIIRYY